MSDNLRLNYHQATFDLIEREPVLDIAALALLDQCEAAYGLTFPASVREWYSLAGSVEILSEVSNSDQSLTLAEMQEAAQNRQAYGELWDYHGLSVLPIMIENQWVAMWAVHLNGSDDPPVLVIDDDDEWKPWEDRFSTFVTGWVWDHFYETEQCVLHARDRPLSPDDLNYLRTTFLEVPHGAHSPIYHFRQDDDRHIHVWVYDEQKSIWWLRAGSKTSLLRLTELVWHCGTLANTLDIQGGYIHGCAGKVLEILRFGHELPEPKWATRGET